MKYRENDGINKICGAIFFTNYIILFSIRYIIGFLCGYDYLSEMTGSLVTLDLWGKVLSLAAFTAAAYFFIKAVTTAVKRKKQAAENEDNIKAMEKRVKKPIQLDK
ncbi:MAG: hypothetical protein GX061_04770 [Eubacteriaceae bacterium]|nr:hypothetical protein [Eubacteriaceae bacterium]